MIFKVGLIVRRRVKATPLRHQEMAVADREAGAVALELHHDGKDINRTVRQHPVWVGALESSDGVAQLQGTEMFARCEDLARKSERTHGQRRRGDECRKKPAE